MAMYNKFITFLVLTFMVSISFAQQYTPMTAAGYQYKRAKVDSTLHIPSFCGVPTLRNSTAIQGALAMDTCANKLYQWTNAAGWSTISTNAIDSLKRSNDSIFARKSGVWVFQYKDSVGGGATPSLQDVATVGNFYYNDYADTLRLNSYDGDIKHPILWNSDFYGGTPNNILDFSYGPNLYENVAKIKFGDNSNLLGHGYIEITDKQSYFTNESSTRTIIQNAPSTYSTYQTTYFPLMKGGTDTLATTEDIRNSAIDTANKWVNNIYRTSGVDSIYYTIGSNTYAIKDSVGSAGGGGGGGKIYYFNGGVNLGTFGGITMYELGDTAITGTAANFTRATTGNIANFITDVNKPGLLQIPAGVWTIDAYLSETGGGSNHAQIYAIVEKWNGSTITVIATSPVEEITNGSAIDLYTYAISVPTTTISATDRIIIQFYIQNTNGKTVTLYTQNGYVGEVHTTFTTGIGALNGLTASTQTFATGTSGTDFNISSATSTHTFNLPTASATNRGALSSANWSTFNSKISPSDTATMLTPYIRLAGTGLTKSSQTLLNNLSTGVSGGQSVVGGTAASNSLTLSSTTNATKGKLLFGTSAYDEVNNRLGIGTASPTYPMSLEYSNNAYNRGFSIKNTNTGTNAITGISLIDAGGLVRGNFDYAPSNFVPTSFANTVLFQSDRDSKLGFAANASAIGGTAQDIWFNTLGTNTTYAMQIKGNGNVQINTNTDAGYKFDVNGTARLQGAVNYNPTNTAAGTTGNQTINKASGTVNIAAAGTTVTVTNSLVTASSIVYAVIRTNDATATIKNVVPAAGSFVINLNAATTAETSIGFFVIN